MSGGAPPLQFTWDGEAMRPKNARIADKHFVIGQEYLLEERHQRSQVSHAHYFAVVEEAWRNLPESMAERFPTAEHLRRYALIKEGFCKSHTLTCSSKKAAEKVAAFIRPADEFSVVTINRNTVTRYVAESQSYKTMDKARFQQSKEAVLGFVSHLIAVKPEQLKNQVRGVPTQSLAREEK